VNATFQALANEASFTKEILASGVTQIRKANYARKGIYFQSFTSLSTGLERIGKLCLMLDYYIQNSGQFPDVMFLKNEIGHDLQILYAKSKEVIDNHKITFHFLNGLEEPLHKEILSVLSGFAKGDRYSNINFLTKQNYSSDPILEWHKKIDLIIYELRVTKKTKKKIESQASLIDIMMSPSAIVQYSSESREDITSIYDASFLTGMTDAVTKYRQLYLLQIIRYWVELLIGLQYKAMSINRNEEIPFFTEIFGAFENSDSYFLSRKNFETF